MRPFRRSFSLRLAQAMTTVTLDPISTKVFNMASGTLRMSHPRGQVGAVVRSRMYDEKSAPKSITSDARNSQIPNFPLYSPVSGRSSMVYGMSMMSGLLDGFFFGLSFQRCVLRDEAVGRAGRTVFVGTVADHRNAREISVAQRRRGGGRPFQRGGFPVIRTGALALGHAPE